VPLDHASVGDASLLARAKAAWDEALALGEKHGYRNAQVSVIAPTGTIGLVMDCDTTGIEPDFALVKFKKLAGGGYFKIINRAVPPALRTLGYTEAQIAEIEAYAVGHGNLNQAPGVNPRRCAPRASPTTRSPRSTRRWARPSTSSSSSTSGRSAPTSSSPSASPTSSSAT
jgi:ribonucleotide reductase alpha subunit